MTEEQGEAIAMVFKHLNRIRNSTNPSVDIENPIAAGRVIERCYREADWSGPLGPDSFRRPI